MSLFFFFFFFNDTATTEIYTLSLHDALPISRGDPMIGVPLASASRMFTGHGSSHRTGIQRQRAPASSSRSEEHTSELQSLAYLVCRLLLEKKKKKTVRTILTSHTDTDYELAL